jgi:tetraacyldisaccharide 4'-kinase
VAGVSRPDRFFADVRDQGWSVAGQLPFRDHHAYSRADVDHILEGARQVRADLILTTEKDAIRLRPFRPFTCRIAWVPLEVVIEPQIAFQEWLWDRLVAARDGERADAQFAP